MINGYVANNAAANSFCTLGDIDKPLYNTTFIVNVEGAGMGTVVINSSGMGTLYNSTMAGYLSGTVRGVVTYYVS